MAFSETTQMADILKNENVSCEVEDFVECHLCKLRGIPR